MARREETEYTVTWTIQLDASSAKAAAKRALAIQRDPASIATVFQVRHPNTGKTVTVDLLKGAR